MNFKLEVGDAFPRLVMRAGTITDRAILEALHRSSARVRVTIERDEDCVRLIVAFVRDRKPEAEPDATSPIRQARDGTFPRPPGERRSVPTPAPPE